MNRRKFFSKFAAIAAGIPVVFGTAKALTKEIYIVKPAYPKSDDDGRTFTGLTTVETQVVEDEIVGFQSMATPNGHYLSVMARTSSGKEFPATLDSRTNKIMKADWA